MEQTRPTPEFAHLELEVTHELREALTLAKGWLQAALKEWKVLDEHDREAMVSAALFGANRVAFLLDVLDGKRKEQVTPAAQRMADDLLRISNEATTN